MARKKREYDDDDGRTIAPMNVDGMPWYTPPSPFQGEDGGEERSFDESRRQARWAALGALKAGLLIAAVFGVVFAAFIAFCGFIWSR